MWDQKHWKWKYPHWIAELVLALAFLMMNFLFPGLELRWKLLAAVAAAAVTAIVLYLVRKSRPEPEEDQTEQNPPY